MENLENLDIPKKLDISLIMLILWNYRVYLTLNFMKLSFNPVRKKAIINFKLL